MVVSVVVNSTVSNAEHPKQLLYCNKWSNIRAIQAWFLSNDFKGAAIDTCLEAFLRYYNYLKFSNPLISKKFDPQACGWAFGMNVFDLSYWKKENVTAKYHQWKEQNADKSLWKLGTLPPGLLAFYGITEPLDRRWHVLGSGHDMNIDNRLIETAAVIHFNGNSKPWLKWSIDRYRPLWERYADRIIVISGIVPLSR